MVGKRRDLMDQQFGTLTALKLVKPSTFSRLEHWECECECGLTVIKTRHWLASHRQTGMCGACRTKNMGQGIEAEYDPTPEEIAAATAKIREGWSPREFYRRAPWARTPWTVPGVIPDPDDDELSHVRDVNHVEPVK